MFLFYTLMCRNYQEYKRKPCWSRIGTFQKSVHQQFLEIVSLTLEDEVKWKTWLLQKCGEFYANNPGPKIRPNPSPDALDMPVLVEPKRGWREYENIYKGRNPRSRGSTNFPPPRQPSWGGEPPPYQHHLQGRRGAKGRRRSSPPRAAAAAASTPGCTSPSSSSSPWPRVSSLHRG